MGVGVGKFPCITCDSSDAMEVYEEDDGSFNATCFSECRDDDKKGYKSNNQLASSDLADELGIRHISFVNGRKKVLSKTDIELKELKKAKKGLPLTKKELQKIKDFTSEYGSKYRNISDKVYEMYRVRHSYDENDQIMEQYVPVFKDETDSLKCVGMHIRTINPKGFRAEGRNYLDCLLFGQVMYVDGKMVRLNGGKYLLIVGGQIDAMSARIMIDQNKKSSHATIDVVSGTTGEGSFASQVANQYDFVSRYEHIIIATDNDAAGLAARQALIDVLPYEKTKVMDFTKGYKDPNEYLKNGDGAIFVYDFYNHKRPDIAGVVNGNNLFSMMLDSVDAPVIPLPPILKPLENKLAGGLPRGEIVNILAASGIGKTTIVNAILKYWILSPDIKPAVLSLEAGAGKFMTRLVSGHLGVNIARMESNEEKIAFLNKHKDDINNLIFDEDGEERFKVVDDKGDLDSLDKVKAIVERLIKQANCNVIVFDPLQDLIGYLSREDQSLFITWQKQIKARYNVTIVNINHTRKAGGGKVAGSQGGQLTEEDMQGASDIYKSAAVNIILSRDKTATDLISRNTTNIMLTKSRDVGDTGEAGKLFYDYHTSTLHNYDVYNFEMIEADDEF